MLIRENSALYRQRNRNLRELVNTMEIPRNRASSDSIHPIELSKKFSHHIPNPFERRQFAFRVLPEEKDPMSRAKKYSFIMPTLTARLQQLISTRVWEYIMLILSIWSFVPLLIGHNIPTLQIFFELTHEITQGLQNF